MSLAFGSTGITTTGGLGTIFVTAIGFIVNGLTAAGATLADRIGQATAAQAAIRI